MVQKKPRGLVLLVLNAHHAPGLVGISLLLPVQHEFDLAKSLGKLGVLPLVEGFHHGRHQLFRCLVFLELVQEPGHGCLSFRVHVFLLCFACKHVGEGFSLSSLSLSACWPNLAEAVALWETQPLFFFRVQTLNPR